MRDRISRYVRIGSTALIFAAPLMLAASVATAGGLERLSAEFQSPGEISTTATPIAAGNPGAPGGTVVYDKTLNIPKGVAYITFSAQGDTHFGAALLMSASITDVAGNVTVCSPMATAGGAALFGAPWMTLVKLPTDGEEEVNNCNDGSGGSADCHDNAFSFSCCALVSDVKGVPNGNSKDVKIRMASSTGDQVFYEDSTIYIDKSDSGGPNGGLCQAVGTTPH